jgi:hypothetical protein
LALARRRPDLHGAPTGFGEDGVYDAFTKRLAETAGAMKVADGF